MSASAAGLAERKLSGPHWSLQPSAIRVSVAPPTRACFSRMVQSAPAAVRSYAAERPEMPPPTPITFRPAFGTWPVALYLRPEIAHDFDAGLHVFHRRFRQNS